ncbi:MAG: phage tail sheath subtilisin-like domain-containing protein [Caldilineaceae bacterium]
MPVAYYAPGVYIEEVDKGTKPIQGVPTSVTAFIGFTQRAEKVTDDEITTRSILGEPTLVTSWSQYERYFGSYHEDAYLPFSVRGFFDNGGARCYVISVRALEPHKAQKVIMAKGGKKQIPSLLVIAKNGGLAGNDIEVKVEAASGSGPRDDRDLEKLMKLSVKVGDKPVPLKNAVQRNIAQNLASDAIRKDLAANEKKWAKPDLAARKKELDAQEKALKADQQKWQDEKAKWETLEKEVTERKINLDAKGDEWNKEKLKWTSDVSLDDVRRQMRAPKKDWEKLQEEWQAKQTKWEADKKEAESGKVDINSLKAEWLAGWEAETEDWAFAWDDIPFWGENNRKNVQKLVNDQSDQVQVWRLNKRGDEAERLPILDTYTLDGGALQFDHLFLQDKNLLDETEIEAARKDPTTEGLIFDKKSTELYRGDEAKRKGIDGLFAIDDINLVCAPDLMKAYDTMEDKTAADNIVKGVQSAILTFCANAHYPFAILDAPPKRDVQGIAEWRMGLPGGDTMYGALYYPWIKIADPFNGTRQIEIPPCGHIAGIYARSDNERVHKAPANEPVNGALDLQINVTKSEQELLNPIGVNCIRAFPGRGIRVWGARTLAMTDPSGRYINVRRLFSYVEASVERSTQWIVFEPNDHMLWAKVRRDITAFLRTVWLSGALFGTTPEQSFYVKCDAETNPPDLRDLGQMVCEIGMAPVKPAEFVIFRFSQWADQVDA